MEDVPRVVVHFVELVDAADATVRQDKCAALQDQLFGLWVSRDVNSQTDGGGPFAGSVDSPRGYLVHILQQLRLGGRRIPAQ